MPPRVTRTRGKPFSVLQPRIQAPTFLPTALLIASHSCSVVDVLYCRCFSQVRTPWRKGSSPVPNRTLLPSCVIQSCLQHGETSLLRYCDKAPPIIPAPTNASLILITGGEVMGGTLCVWS